MLLYILDLFSAAQFVPHAVCLLWRPDLLVMHGLSDFLIAASYLSIPVLILRAAHQRPDLIDLRVARMFAAFITFCAMSHFVGLITLWVPAYGIHGVVKVATALVSIYTAITIAKLVPALVKYPSIADLARKEAEILVMENAAAETEAVRSKLEEFAYIASHDLRTPIRGIANHTRFIVEDHGEVLPADARKRLDRMVLLCGQVDKLITDLLNYSRVGRRDALNDVDSQVLLDDLKSSLGELLEEIGGEIVFETPLPVVQANPADLGTVFRNLISNGLTYNTSQVRQVVVGYTPSKMMNGRRMVDVFYVRDNGIGIAPEYHKDIFAMFKRLNQADEFGQSSGAGLAFVDRILDTNRGEIELISNPGAGSTFFFSFSRAPEPEIDSMKPDFLEGRLGHAT